MKIGNFEFNFGRAQNADKPVANDSRVLTKLIRTQLVRSRSQIKDWTDATTNAESIIAPNRAELIRIYNNVVVDPHLSAVMTTLKLKIVDASWKIYTGDKVDEKVSDVLRAGWFRKILESFVDAEFYGFTLVQLGDIVNGKFQIEYVPRENVVPELRVVKRKVFELKDAIEIDADPYADWLVFADSGTLGLLHKASPLIIQKRAVLSAWSEYAEIFGSPIRIGKTDIRDPRKYANMDEMLSKMGSMAYGVFDPSDVIEFIETSKGDAFNVFNEFAKQVDQQVSKLILGQTGTTDEKAFAGSANVHDSILDGIVESYVEKMVEFVNDVVFPKLVKHNIGINAGHRMKIQGENNIASSLQSMSPLVANKILESMTVNEIRDLIGLQPDDSIVRQTPTTPIPSVMNKVSELYAELLHSHDGHQHK